MFPGNSDDSYFLEFKKTIFISSKGFLNSADHADKYKLSGTNSFDIKIENIKDYDTIYVCTDAIKKFAKILPKIKKKFILFSGDSTLSINDKNFSDEVKKILQSNYLVRWYAQNLDFRGDKLEHLPLGLDYHTGYENPDFFQSEKLFPFQQEYKILEVAANSMSISRRKIKIYSNWHFYLDRGDRKECFKSIDKNICFFEPKRIERFKSYANLSSYAFATSPLGSGFDCHRTYEAILLGSIPIIKKSPIASIFQDLPVCIVENWSIVDESYLQYHLEKILNRKFNFSILFNTFWQAKTNQISHNEETGLRMTLLEFRNHIKHIYKKYKNEV